MIIAAIAISLVSAQGSTVTFEARAARMPVVLQALSTASNLKLEVSPALETEVLAIRVTNVPVDTLMSKIAAVTTAEWKKDGEVLRLVPSQAARTRDLNEERTRRVAGLRKALAERVKAMQTPPKQAQGEDDFDPEMLQSMRANSLPEQTITQLLQGVDLTALAMLNAGERVVYSTRPTAMQRPLGNTAGQLITALVADHNKKIVPRPTEMSDEEAKFMETMPDFMKQMIDRQSKPIQNPEKALLIGSRMDFGMMASTNLELRIYDTEGKVVYSNTSMLDPGAFMDLARMGGEAGEEAPAKQSPAVTYSADSKAIQESFGGFSMAGMNIKIEPKVRELLSKPDVKDPLSFMATDELFSLAKAKGKALVANVPDAMMSSASMFFAGEGQTVEDVERELKDGEDVSLTETEGWVVVKPANPSHSREDRTDRTGLAQLIRAGEMKGMPDLDDLSSYAQTSPNPMDNGIGQMYAMLVVPGMMTQSMSGLTDWNALRLYGTLSPTQRQNLLGGGGIPVSGMTPAQQALWRKMLFGTTTSIMVGEVKSELPFMSMMSMMGGMTSDYRQEPTELMPNGLPGAATMTMSSTTQPFANPVGENNTPVAGYLGVLGLDELAMFKMFTEDPNMQQMAGFMPQLNQLRVGTRTIYNIRMQLPQQAYAMQALNDNKVDKNSPVVSMTTLPPDFQKQLAARMEELKKSPLGMLGGMMGGQRGPIKP